MMKLPRLLALLLFGCGHAIAGVTAERTRVIVNEGQREVSLVLVNQNDYPVMVQAWIDDGSPDAGPDEAEAPVIPLPAMFQLAPGQRQNLRLLYVGPAPTQERESMYWLNLLEIPPSPVAAEQPDPARLTVTMRTQMKVFYRPSALKTGASHAAAKLDFRTEDGQLFAANASPFHITLAELFVCQRQAITVAGEGLLAPQTNVFLAASVPACTQGDDAVEFSWIDDEGNRQQGMARFSAR